MEKEESSGITISCLVSFLYFVVRLASDWRKNRQNTKKEERENITRAVTWLRADG